MSEHQDNFHAFFEEVLATGYILSVLEDGGIPTPTNQDGEKAMPFWSSVERAQEIIDLYDRGERMQAVRIPLASFKSEWLPGIARDNMKVGINWFGRPAAGTDIDPSEVLEHLEGRAG